MNRAPSHVLVVDDDALARELVREVCEAAGFRVSMAVDGVEGLEKLRRESPDLLLLDVTMPRLDGYAVLKSIREDPALAELAVILLTATEDLDGKIRGMELGADDFVTKPFRLAELQTRISSALKVREWRKRRQTVPGTPREVDPVTEAGTPAQLRSCLEGELARARRYGRPAAALVFGFDDGPGLRSRLGSEGCDALLGKMASEVRACLRDADRLFRLDSGEWVIVLPETDLAGARRTAERLGKVVNQPGANGALPMKVRIGGAAFPHERVRSSEDLLSEAGRVFRALREAGPDQLIFDV